ncbi:PH domain-containing protein [Streptomyces carpaticus]|uniref:PH domain-containing protein n=1 Tax=Streptomyces carpaticus TaxID=285558 RepID=A0ABV4ZT45_9ACTN
MRRRWYPWEEIANVTVVNAEVFLTLTNGSRVRLPAPAADSEADPRFRRSVIEIHRRRREATTPGR